jgi:phosphatidylglycerol:prolipoprotein diacylglycerol transferase
MIVCGFLLCLYLLTRRGRRMGIDPTALFDTAVLILLCGIIGARVFHVVHHWKDFSGNLLLIFRIDLGGLAFFGGLIGGIVGLLIGIVRKGLPPRATLDLGASVLPLGHAFGRVGCFLNGCCFGRATKCFLGVRFPKVTDAAGHVIGSPPFSYYGGDSPAAVWSKAVHPTQLYAVAYNLAIFAVLSLLLWKRRRAGDIAWLYLVFYGTARFCNEFVRVDTPPLRPGGTLNIFHLAALAAMTVGVALTIRSRTLPAEPLPEPWEPPAEEG